MEYVLKSLWILTKYWKHIDLLLVTFPFKLLLLPFIKHFATEEVTFKLPPKRSGVYFQPRLYAYQWAEYTKVGLNSSQNGPY